jgi:predicted acetyltransferase
MDFHLYTLGKCNDIEEDIKTLYNIINNDEVIKGTFKNIDNRIVVSEYMLFIIMDQKPIGFILLVPEQVNKCLFIDMGIKCEYRSKGYGKKALEILLEQGNIEKYIIAETKNNNLLANSSASDIGILVYQNDNKNYYLFNKEKYNDFINDEDYDLFINHFKNGALTYSEVMENIYKEREKVKCKTNI